MPVYRKQRNSASGGNPSSIFNNPGFGLGLEYIPTAPDLPDMEGLMYLENAKNNARTQLESLRKEMQPDSSELLTALDDLEMFNSQKDDFKRAINEKVSAFRSKMVNDPDYAFSMQARQDFADLKQELSASRYQNNALRYKEINEDFKNASTKGFGQEMYVVNGRIPIIDTQNPGELKMVTTEEAKNLLEEGDRYSLIGSSSNLYDYYHKNTGKNFNNYQTFSGRMTSKDAKEEIDQVFKNVASSVFENITEDDISRKSGVAIYQQIKNKVKDNTGQLNAAIQQVIETLSPQAEDALRGVYLSQTGDLSTEGFNNYLGRIISGEASIRLNNESTLTGSGSVLSTDLQGEALMNNSLGVPVKTTGSRTVDTDKFFPQWLGAEHLSIPILAKSSIPNNAFSKYDEYDFTNATYVYNKDYIGTTGTSGAPKGITTLYEAKRHDNVVIPVSTGEKLTKDPKTGKWVKSQDADLPLGHMLAAPGPDGSIDNDQTIVSTEIKNIEYNGAYYKGYEKKDGSVVIISPKAFEMIIGYDEPEDGDRTMVFHALDETQAAQRFSDPTLSLSYKTKDYFDNDNNRLLPEAKESLQSTFDTLEASLAKLDDMIDGEYQGNPVTPQQISEATARRAELSKGTSELKQAYNMVLGVERGEFEVNTAQEIELYSKLRATINAYLSDIEKNKDMETVKRYTTAIDNSMKANTSFNNIY